MAKTLLGLVKDEKSLAASTPIYISNITRSKIKELSLDRGNHRIQNKIERDNGERERESMGKKWGKRDVGE